MHEGTGRPTARRDGLLVEVMDDELLVFDTERKVAHSLNETAARVWRACDGEHDFEALMVECEVDEPTLALALERLEGVDLLQQTTGLMPPPAADGVSRRVMLRRSVLAGAGIGVAIPVIRSITAPSVAMASSTSRNPQNGVACTNVSTCAAGSICSASTHVCTRGQNAACFHGSTASKTSQCPIGHTCTGQPGMCT